MTLRGRFVDSISDTPTVRLDLNADPWRLLASSRFDPPAAKRSRASTLLTDGAIYPASAYDDRVLELHLGLRESSADDAATAIQQLARELDRPRGSIFEYRLSGQTESVFFRTVRLAMESVELIPDGSTQRVVAPVIAEPFAYGLPVDLGSFVVSNDPAAGTNPTFFDVAAADVLGDVEAPMRLFRQHVVELGSPATMTFAVRRRGDLAEVPYLLQAEAMTQGTDTTTQTNDAAFSGSGNNYSRVAFVNTTMAQRLRIAAWPASPTLGARGMYRVFARVRRTSATGTIRMRLDVGGRATPGLPSTGLGMTQLDPVTLPETTEFRMVDLGLVQFPVRSPARTDGPSGVELPTEGARVEVRAARDSGSSDLDIDYLLFMPADDRLSFAELLHTWEAATGSGLVVDSYHDLLYGQRDSGAVVNSAVGQVTGSLPMLRPGVDNRIYYLDSVQQPVDVSRTFEVSYWPRYLTVRPDDVPAP